MGLLFSWGGMDLKRKQQTTKLVYHREYPKDQHFTIFFVSRGSSIRRSGLVKLGDPAIQFAVGNDARTLQCLHQILAPSLTE